MQLWNSDRVEDVKLKSEKTYLHL